MASEHVGFIEGTAMTAVPISIDQLCVNTIRALAMDTVQQAKSGHPGTPMGAAAMTYALWSRHLKHNPANPTWADRDRFVLSPGHASVLLYSMLGLTGYALPLEELKRFRQWGSLTPGHPEYGHTTGVEVTTGPLGAGFAMGVGMAMAERFQAEHFNRPGHQVVDHFTYGICSDGDLMEGVSAEAASLAGTLKLGKLIYLYDDNGISIEGDTDIAFAENVGRRFQAYGWHVQSIDGNDIEAVDQALRRAKAEHEKPSLIIARTVIAFGSPNKAGMKEAHGAPLGEEEVRLTKRLMDYPEEPPFFVPEDALREFRRALDRGREAESAWEMRFAAYGIACPEEAALWRQQLAGRLPEGWEAALPTFTAADGAMATRVASGKTLNGLITVLEGLVGGSADLAPSTNTYLKGYGDLGMDEWCGHNVRFGVREHAMGCIANGMAVHGGLIPYCATFFVFSDYMRPPVRMAALMKAKTIFVFTHDSIGVGEDGPTHQPIEQLASFRAMPGLSVIRPADANETAAAWGAAIQRQGPTALILCRQDVPIINDVAAVRAGVPRGAYVLENAASGEPDVILVATGSEVSIALDARALLAKDGVGARVVSMPSWDLFEAQPQSYRDSVLPPDVRARVVVEAASPMGWTKYTGDLGEVVALDHFGASAPAARLYAEFGLTAEHVAAAAKRTIARAKGA